MGRKESVWGQMGVRRMAGKSGWTREPPAEREYAVDPVEQVSDTAHKWGEPINKWNLPVGVEKMQPSAWTTVKSSLSP